MKQKSGAIISTRYTDFQKKKVKNQNIFRGKDHSEILNLMGNRCTFSEGKRKHSV